ncbi:hypothetical protein [Xylophilus sp. GOD-11R]|uniref:hypothetical protein n=1 Tax=Xylophilus sp. GOD-11R TaxID=3089814 RepID=UPI00298C1E04|nr:hypothetical protein [Xylophilus sp. GOD-11R]WPB57929.1 hypothetical protein R9X41_04595 [Xylophilus sp. GOD-11R]
MYFPTPHVSAAQQSSVSPLAARTKDANAAGAKSAEVPREDERFSDLLGAPPAAAGGHFSVQESTAVDAISMPASRVEEIARDALESMLKQIDDQAGQYLALRDHVLANGSPEQLAALETTIANFLRASENAMVKLVANVSTSLIPPSSPAMEKLLKFVGTDIWDGIRELEREMQDALDEEIKMGIVGDVDGTRYAETCRYLARQLGDRLNEQARQIGVGQVQHFTFNPRQLTEVIAMNAQLKRAKELALAPAPMKAPTDMAANQAAKPVLAQRPLDGNQIDD